MQFQGIAVRATAVTPHDTNTLGPTIGLYVGTGGNVTVQLMTEAVSITFNSIPAGTWMPVSVRRVMSTGTTASNIVALLDS